MNLHWIDWLIVTVMCGLLFVLALMAKKYNKSVADFLVASRCAKRYLLTISLSAGLTGALVMVGTWEMLYETGFSAIWWWKISAPVYLLITTTGFIIYRYRETRSMTLGQFFQTRYSRNFRIFSGILGFVCGIITFGIYPAVGSRFFIYFCGLPETTHLFGFNVSTFAMIMILLLSTSLFFTWIGGHVAVIITDFAQGAFMMIAFVIALFAIFYLFDWSHISEALALAPEGKSLVNPLKGGEIKNYNVWYFVIFAFMFVYGHQSQPGQQTYTASAASPHEMKMAGILAPFRSASLMWIQVMIPIAALVVMRHPNYALQAAKVNQALGIIGDEQIREQMTVSVVMGQILPLGIKGIICAAMLAAFISTHDTLMHNWGSIFLQDVIMPFRKKPFEPKQHMLLLRLAIMGVAVFVFFFSLLFKQTQAVYIFVFLSGAIFVAGSGAALIGGLYWKRGATGGAWGAMITGAVIAIAGLTLEQLWPILYEGQRFPINGMYVNAIAMGSATFVYISISLYQNKIFNMDRMLRRGMYRIDEESADNIESNKARHELKGIRKFLYSLGLTEEFTLGDKFWFFTLIIQKTGWFLIFISVTVYGIFVGISDSAWFTFWNIYAWIGFALSIIITIWFFVFGLRDLKSLFKSLRSVDRDDKDDGMVLEAPDETSC